jgi:DNA-binding SARP family transcriptional activator/TolB-like protein
VPFTVRTLGGAHVEAPAGPLAGRAAHRRRLALLALLASSRTGSMTREKVIGYLWPEYGSARARRLLSVALSDMRRELGEHAFVSAGDELSLNPEVVASDVAAFEAALRAGDWRGAVELYRGPFLDGFHVDDAPEFEKWVDAERGRLDQAYAGALGRLAEAAEATGAAEEAARWWRRAAAHDRCSSRVALRLMQALEAAGDRVSAIRHAEAHEAALREELGIEPDARVAALAARLRSDPGLPAPPAVPVPSAPVRAETGSGMEAVVEAGDAEEMEAPREEAGDVRESGEEEQPAGTREAREEESARDPVESAAASHHPLPPSTRPRPRARHTARITYLAGVFVVAVVALWALQDGRLPEAAEPPAAANQIAVLYFENQSSDRDLEYLAGDLTENLIHQLAQVEGLHVVSPNGVRPFRDRAVPPDSLRRSLGVGTLLSAGLRRSGDSVHLAVHLVDANSGRELAGTLLSRAMGERFALGNDLAAEVADFLRVRLGKEIQLREWTVGTRNPLARELLARAEEMRAEGLEAARRPDSVAVLTARRMLDIADTLLAQAGRLDRAWVEPSIRRGWLAIDRVELTDVAGRRSWTALARRHAESALALEPGYAPALELRGTAYWQEADNSIGVRGYQELVTRAEADLRAATAADASLASAWSTLSRVLRFKPDLEEAEFAARRAYEEDAYLRNVDQVLDVLYRTTLFLERPAESARWCHLGRHKFPGDWRFVQCELAILSHPSTAHPDPERALAVLDELEDMDPLEKARLAGRPYYPVYRTVRAAAVLARAGQERRGPVAARPGIPAGRRRPHGQAAARLRRGVPAPPHGREGAGVPARRPLHREPPRPQGVRAPGPALQDAVERPGVRRPGPRVVSGGPGGRDHPRPSPVSSTRIMESMVSGMWAAM